MKEYLLLRNNKQTGPYSIDELKAMGLRPFDLLWLQHKSFSWKYPTEMDELAALMPAIENINTIACNTDERIIKINETVVAEMAGADRYFNTAEQESAEEAPVKYFSHIVALKPSIDHIQIKTIKSTSQPSVVKVEIRDKEITPAHHAGKEVAFSQETAYIVPDSPLLSEYTVAPQASLQARSSGVNNFFQTKK